MHRGTETPVISRPSEVETEPPQSWGAERVRGALRRVRMAEPVSGFARRIATLAPVLVVAASLMFLAVEHYQKGQFKQHGGMAGFATLGQSGAQIIGRPDLWSGSKYGYDGQYFFYVAYRPSLIVTCSYDRSTCPVQNPDYRWQRILYPMTARLLALGRPDWIPTTLVLVNALAVLVTVAVVGQLSVEAGASRWLGACAGLFCGELLCFLGDLGEAYCTMWVVLAIYLLRHRRYFWSAVAVAAALLSRESLIFYVPFLAFPPLVERSWRALLLGVVVGLGPFAAWQIVLRMLYGTWTFITSDSHSAGLLPRPFLGLYLERTVPDFTHILIFVVVPLLATCVVAVMAIWDHGPADLLRDPVPLMALIYCVLMIYTAPVQWSYFWAPTRLAAPGVVIGVIAAARLRSLSLRTSYATVIAFSGLSALIAVFG